MIVDLGGVATVCYLAGEQLRAGCHGTLDWMDTVVWFSVSSDTCWGQFLVNSVCVRGQDRRVFSGAFVGS
jgi:hypothetical protein